MTVNNETHIFDDVFRTMEEHTPELMLPLINEVFKTNYPENTKITRLADKRHLLRQLVETDSCLSIGGKLYHFECESNPNNGTIAIRMFQYDVTVALEGKQREKDRFVVEFPASCVIYLRHGKNTRDKETVLVRMPDGRELEYAVPVVKSQKYEKEEIFKKKLYPFIVTRPFASCSAFSFRINLYAYDNDTPSIFCTSVVVKNRLFSINPSLLSSVLLFSSFLYCQYCFTKNISFLYC